MLREIPPQLSRIKSFAKPKSLPRSMHAIMAGLLQVCEQKTKRTHVIYKVNLSHTMLLEYVRLALKNGLIEEMSDRSLLTTERGRAYLEHFSIVENMLRAGVPRNDNNNNDNYDDDNNNDRNEYDARSCCNDEKIALPMTTTS